MTCAARDTKVLCASHGVLHWIPAFAGMTVRFESINAGLKFGALGLGWGASEVSGGSYTSPQGAGRHVSQADGIHRDIRQHAKAQATPPQPSPTAAGEGAIPRKDVLSSCAGFVIKRQDLIRGNTNYTLLYLFDLPAIFGRQVGLAASAATAAFKRMA
jgi:hypothetical protein